MLVLSPTKILNKLMVCLMCELIVLHETIYNLNKIIEAREINKIIMEKAKLNNFLSDNYYKLCLIRSIRSIVTIKFCLNLIGVLVAP